MGTTTPPSETTNGSERSDDRPEGAGAGSSAGRAPEPPADVSLLRAAIAHPIALVLPIVICVVGALTLTLGRDAVYTAETRLSVGRIDVATQAIPGVVAGTQALASSYSRLVDAQEVLAPVAESTGLPATDLRDRVSGSPIPESPLFIVEATADTEEGAVELVNLTAESLSRYVSRVNSGGDASAGLLKQYRQAVAQAERAQANLNRANNQGTPADVQQATAAVRTFELRVEVLGDLYRQSLQGTASSNQIQVVNPASDAESDAGSFRRRIVLLAVLAGLVTGLILAGLATRRQTHVGVRRTGNLRRLLPGS